jgi:hypothetical protein
VAWRTASPLTRMVAWQGMVAVLLGVLVVVVHWEPLRARLCWRTLSCFRQWGGGRLAR